MSELYKAAGVDAATGDRLVDWLGEDQNVHKQRPTGQALEGIGGFAALWRPNFQGMKDPLLVSSTDGVGTKLLLALEHDRLDGLGIDLVAMCVNDLYTLGAEPMFFLDYFATAKLEPQQFKRVLSSIKKGLEIADTVLLGGETAEMPGLYGHQHFDLAGFVVGVVDGAKRLGPHRVQAGDQLIALESQGFHSNGFSLIRKWLSKGGTSPAMIEYLLRPTTIYRCLPQLLKEFGASIHAAAHITGGGISGNLPRVLPQDTQAAIKWQLVPTSDIMRSFIEEHQATVAEVEEVFNLGVGMILVVDYAEALAIKTASIELGFKAHQIGVVKPSQGEAKVVYF